MRCNVQTSTGYACARRQDHGLCIQAGITIYCISRDRCLGSHKWAAKRSGLYFCVHARSAEGRYGGVCNKWNTDFVLVRMVGIPCGYLPLRLVLTYGVLSPCTHSYSVSISYVFCNITTRHGVWKVVGTERAAVTTSMRVREIFQFHND